jgi:hypothetical protein
MRVGDLDWLGVFVAEVVRRGGGADGIKQG